MFPKKFTFLSLILVFLNGVSFNGTPVYKNPQASVEDRVSDLLSRMTPEEKVAQMLCVWNEKNPLISRENGGFDVSGFKEMYPDGIGQVGRPYDALGGLTPTESVKLTNEIQRYAVEQTRLGIPVLFHAEALHGYAAKGATSFPQPIGLASTFNPDLVRDIYGLVASEVRKSGSHQVLSPVVDVARDPRWGRVEETFGEDPCLVAEMGLAAVQGFQGNNDFSNTTNVLSTLKHFAGHGHPESGTNIAPANYSERIIREVFLYPFKRSVIDGEVVSVMASYNEIDGVPSHASQWLLHDILRDEWQFEGFVVSDYYALRELHVRPGLFGQGVAENEQKAASLAAFSGVNIELPEPDIYPHVLDQIKTGGMDMKVIDALVGDMLAYKFKLGLFENPYSSLEAVRDVGSEEARALARKAAQEAIVLLQNRNNVAPISRSRKMTIAVIGPNANRSLLGGYSGIPNYDVSVLAGIKKLAGENIEIVHHEGCKITDGGSWQEDEVKLADPDENRKRIREAVALAKNADVIVLALGGNEQTSREAWAADHMGDRADLQMVGEQDELVNALAELGKPLISFLFNGKPLAVNNLVEKSDVIFECWYLGQESGLAVADVLFGDYNPGGKMPITVPRSVGHIPAYYNYKPSARRGYLFDDITPLFAFGHGLSYAAFAYSKPELSSKQISRDEKTTISVEVTNTSAIRGEEVVQLYIRDQFSSVTRPVKELKAFKRIALDPGQSTIVQLEVGFEEFAFYDINMDFTVEPGDFNLMIGGSSNDSDLQVIQLTVN